VSHPDGGKRKLAYDGASSVWPFQRPYSGDPVHGLRGTFVHSVCDMADRGEPLTAEHYAEAAELGMSEELVNYIYARWIAARKNWGITTVAIEQPYVNDGLRVASNADRIDRDADGVSFYGDIKTARHAHKVDYLVQLATIKGALPYDLEGDCRGEWVGTPSHTRAAIYHFPVADAVGKPRDEWPDWSLIWVDITHGVTLNESLAALRDTDVTHAFHLVDTSQQVAAPGGDAVRSDEVAAPTPPLQVVELPDGGDATHGTAASPPSTLDGWRAAYEEWDGDKREAFARYRFERGVTADATEAERLECYKGFHAEYTFGDVTTVPQLRATPSQPVRATLRDVPPDEGPDATDDAYEALRARYQALDPAASSWVSAIATQAKRAGYGVHMSESRTVRRFEINRGLVALAGAGFDNDDAIRGCLATAIGAELADSMSFTLGQLVGHMDATQAAVFADVAVTLAEGGASMRFTSEGRCRVEVAA
jgi:hypothetical protein